MRRPIVALVLLAGLVPFAAVRPGPAATSPSGGPGDATVIAILDNGFSPYHWDFLADKMPQATNSDPSDDLPLTQSPDTWLPGFPPVSSFASFDALNLTLDGTNPATDPATLEAADAAKWAMIQNSDPSNLHYYWLPGTKVIGAMTFNGGQIRGPMSEEGPHGTSGHGTGTTSVSVGNIHGTCPECLLLFIQAPDDATATEQAMTWAMQQPWIDAISISTGFSFPLDDPRTRIWSGSDVAGEKSASDRGQTIFFSAGNGLLNDFSVPNTTLLSSQEGPDWIVTVGAVSSDLGPEPIFAEHASFTGHGKPADIASIGDSYPSAIDSTTVSGKGEFGFSGTSNAAPVIAGTYSRALYLARRDLAGASRTQAGGVIASGGGFVCGTTRPGCELGDGRLTASELRTRLFHGAVHTPPGMTVAGLGPSLPPIGEDEFLNEGHGSYFGREHSIDAEWLAELDRLLGPLEGRAATIARPDGEAEWMMVDSWCRQHIWGDWTGGYYQTGDTLPGLSPAWPLRSAILTACPLLQAPPRFFRHA